MATAHNPLKEKVQTVPLVCVEAICRFTPTSKLIRLYSNAVPLPGAFWNLGLKTVLNKRFPLSLHDDLLNSDDVDDFCDTKALYDITGAKVATIEKPDMFGFCPLREFIESATLTVRFLPMHRPDEPPQASVVHGDALLSNLPNVVRLVLAVRDIGWRGEEKDRFQSCLKHLLPRLQSFEVRNRCSMPNSQAVLEASANFIDEAGIAEMNRLRRLVLLQVTFDHLLSTAANQSTRMQAVLAGLSSFGISRCDYFAPDGVLPAAAAISFVPRCCGHLSQLQVVVRGEFRAYLVAFRAFPGLNSLGLYVLQADLTGLTVDESEPVTSMSDFRVDCRVHAGASIFKIASFFPNAKAVALNGQSGPLELAKSLFGEIQLFPAVANLGRFYSDEMLSCSSQHLSQFLANPHLPEAVNLSQIIIIFEKLTRDADLLMAIYCAMQASSIKKLLLRGPVHSEALARLQSHVDLNGENAKISAWTDHDLGDQPGILDFSRNAMYCVGKRIRNISHQTDFQIIGLKTFGNLKGERFTVRVFHQLAKRVDMFDWANFTGEE